MVTYYVYENRFNQSDIRGWEVRFMPLGFQSHGGPSASLLSGSVGWHYLTLCMNREKPNQTKCSYIDNSHHAMKYVIFEDGFPRCTRDEVARC